MCSMILQNGPISMFWPGERVLWCAVVCLRELLHLAWIEWRQRMSNYYQSHLVHPQSWCCSCVTSPPNPHIWSAKWPPELRAALQHFDTPSLHTAFSSVITEDVKWGHSLLRSNRCSLTLRNSPSMSQRYQKSSFAVTRPCCWLQRWQEGLYHQELVGGTTVEASWLLNFPFVLVY